MNEKGHKELQDLLKEGASALINMRKGLQNACAELRTIYSRTVYGKGKPETRDSYSGKWAKRRTIQ